MLKVHVITATRRYESWTDYQTQVFFDLGEARDAESRLHNSGFEVELKSINARDGMVVNHFFIVGAEMFLPVVESEEVTL